MQAGFARYGQELLLFRPPGRRAARAVDRRAGGRQPGSARRRRSTPSPWPGSTRRSRRSRSSASRRTGSATGSARAPGWRVPRSSLAPILRFADVEALRPRRARRRSRRDPLDAFLQVGVAKEDQPHYLKILARPEADTAPLVEYGLGVISARNRNGGSQRSRGHRARADLRVADRSAPRGGRVRRRVDRHAADEGDRRASRRAGPRPGHPMKDPSRHQGRNR